MITGTIIKDENELKIRVKDTAYGTLILRPDAESRNLLEIHHVLEEVEGYIIKTFQETPDGIRFDAWLFHIESFEES